MKAIQLFKFAALVVSSVAHSQVLPLQSQHRGESLMRDANTSQVVGEIEMTLTSSGEQQLFRQMVEMFKLSRSELKREISGIAGGDRECLLEASAAFADADDQIRFVNLTVTNSRGTEMYFNSDLKHSHIVNLNQPGFVVAAGLRNTMAYDGSSLGSIDLLIRVESKALLLAINQGEGETQVVCQVTP